MSRKRKIVSIAVFVCVVIVLLIAIILTGQPGGKHETIEEAMRDAVLHETGKLIFWVSKM